MSGRGWSGVGARYSAFFNCSSQTHQYQCTYQYLGRPGRSLRISHIAVLFIYLFIFCCCWPLCCPPAFCSRVCTNLQRILLCPSVVVVVVVISWLFVDFLRQPCKQVRDRIASVRHWRRSLTARNATGGPRRTEPIRAGYTPLYRATPDGYRRYRRLGGKAAVAHALFYFGFELLLFFVFFWWIFFFIGCEIGTKIIIIP